MKKILKYCMLACILSFSVINSQASTMLNNGTKKANVETMTKEQKAARLKEIRQRVDEIRAMDKSTLSKDERRAIKNELKEMKKEAKVMSGGVYLSVGAIIIIILLLIIIL